MKTKIQKLASHLTLHASLLLFSFFVFHFSLAQPAERMQWFADARLGIFIH
ncbi:MAG: hypothetical protein R6W71_08855 [Bacteroidales bacterium]